MAFSRLAPPLPQHVMFSVAVAATGVVREKAVAEALLPAKVYGIQREVRYAEAARGQREVTMPREPAAP